MSKPKKDTTTMAQLQTKYRANCERIGEIAELCEKENRERNDKENDEYALLERDNQILAMRMRALDADNFRDVKLDRDQILRDCMTQNKVVHIMAREDVTPQTTAALADTGIIPIQEQEMLKPIREGLIYDKVGLNIRAGLVGTLRWPKHTKAVAQWADEAERLDQSQIDFSALTTQGHRLGIAIAVTKEELYDSLGVVQNVINAEMPASIIDAINEALFTTEATYVGKDSQTHNKKVVGPFVKAYQTAMEFAGAVPTRKELLKLKARVAKQTGLKMIAPCWVMTEDMKCELEDTKVDAGSGRFVCENDHILGYPVFCTDVIGEGNIGFGDWSYQAAGFFGPWDVVVDPYTLATKYSVNFVLNTRFGTVTLRDEAFTMGKAHV